MIHHSSLWGQAFKFLKTRRGVEDARAAPSFQSNRVLVEAPWNRDDKNDYPSYDDIMARAAVPLTQVHLRLECGFESPDRKARALCQLAL